MQEKIRVIQHGLGIIGARIVRALVEKDGVEVVGAIAHRKEKVGRDLGEVVGLDRKLGVVVSDDADAVFSETVADAVVDATYSYVKELYPFIAKAVKAKLNFISVCEELSYPWLSEPELALSIDKLARKYGVSVLGTGGNPGFVFDALPIFFSGACERMRKIRARRINDSRSVVGSRTIIRHFGVGLTLKEWERKKQEGIVGAHVGLQGSMIMVAQMLGWKVEIKETVEPLIAKVRKDFPPHLVIEPGQVFGCKQVGRATKDGEEVMNMEMLVGWGLDLKAEELERPNICWIEGEPNIEITWKATGHITEARAINSIPYVVDSRPGLLKVTELPLISCLM